MRHSCLDCARKHLSQALVLCQECLQGYPIHGWYAVGHMAEASDELLSEHQDVAERIREERLALMASLNANLSFDTEEDLVDFKISEIHQVPFEELISELCITKIQAESIPSDYESS